MHKHLGAVVAKVIVVVGALLVGACGGDNGPPREPLIDAPPAIDAFTLPSTCDQVLQDCPTGYKCSFVIKGILVNGCQPAGTKTEDEACTGQDGADDCAPGLLCADGRCQRFCKTAQDCGTGQSCAQVRVGNGLCQDPCTPFDPASCPANTTCDFGLTYLTGAPITFCRGIGSSAVGGQCNGGPFDPLGCGANHSCAIGGCVPLCDATHACASGTCTLPADFTPNPTQAGACLP